MSAVVGLQDFYQHLEYNENDLAGLEASVHEQMAQGTYRVELNLTILKYYGLYPALYNNDVVVRILLLALMRLPSTDFTEVLYQLPTDLLKAPVIAQLIDLEGTLERCEFQQFWKKVENAEPQIKALLYSAATFEECIRRFTIETIGCTCLKVSTADFLTLLNLTDASDPRLTALLAEKKWVVAADGVVTTALRVDAPSKAEDHVTEASRHLKTSLAMLSKKVPNR